MKGKKVLWIFVILGFILTLYMVEASSFGSSEVALHNEGYGTFDMKKYDTQVVKEVLEQADTECIHVYHKYYLADFLFILFFGLLQGMISNAVYSGNKLIYRRIAVSIPIARGIFDVIENILLLVTINNYPEVNAGVIKVASIATQCKLWCIRIWVVLILVGLLYCIYRRIFAKQR